MGKEKNQTQVSDEPPQKAGEYHQNDSLTATQVQPDGGYGWVVCFTSMCTNGTVFGSINTFGILYLAMLEQYSDASDKNISFKTAWVGSVCTGLTFLMCMVASILSDRIGIRKVAFFGGALAFIGMLSSVFVEDLMLYYLTYGVVMGLGFAFVYAPSLVILGHYFKKRMGLVNGLVTFGSAVFTIVYSLVLPELLKTIGLKYTLLCLAGLIFLLMPYSLTWKPKFQQESNLAALALSSESIVEHLNDCCRWTRKYLNVKIWRNRGYVVWAVANGVSLFGYFIPFVHLVKHTKDIFPDSNGSFLPMCISITSGLSRIIFGFIADTSCISRMHMQQAAFILLGVTTSCIPFADSFVSLIIICLVMGLCDGLFICLLGPIAFDLVGEQGASQALGFLFSIFSVPMTVGPPVAGLLYDYLGSYKIAFHVAGAPPIIGALIMFLIPRHKQHIPAVTEIEEFAGVSCPDIYSSRSVQDASNRVTAKENRGPSKTELVVLSGQETLDLLRTNGLKAKSSDDGFEDEDYKEDEKIGEDGASEEGKSLLEKRRELVVSSGDSKDTEETSNFKH